MSKHGQGLQACVSWLPAFNGQVPYNAIPAAQNVFIARGRVGNDVVPGKLVHGQTSVGLPWDGKENLVNNYEVLCDTGLHRLGPEVEWVSQSNGQVPSGAVIGGMTQNGEPLYIARARVNGEWVVGKVHTSHQCAYFPVFGQENKQTAYEVLKFNGH
jgi:hypothetical protein